MWRSTNDLVNHVKDIHEVQNTQSHLLNHVCCQDLAAKPGCVHTQWTRSREGPQHTHNSTILRMPILQEILTNSWKSTKNASSATRPGQHQKVHNDINDHNHITHFLCGWSNTTSTKSTTFHTLTAPKTMPVIPPWWP